MVSVMLVKKVNRERHPSKVTQNHQLMSPYKCFIWIYLVQSTSRHSARRNTIIDDFTRFSWTFLLHSKDEESQIIINHIKAVDNGTKWEVKKIRSDNGTEFNNSTMKNFCDENGLTHPRTPQQNGVVESKNMTLIEAARTMLEQSNLPTYFWAEAINTACFTQNISIVNQSQGKTPYQLIKNK